MKAGRRISLSTMQTSGEMPMPAPMVLAGWWGDKFKRLYLNTVQAAQHVKSVSVTVDLIPERRVASIENAWVADPDVAAGRRGCRSRSSCGLIAARRIERNFTVKIPEGLERKGDHRILLSDAETIESHAEHRRHDGPLHRICRKRSR